MDHFLRLCKHKHKITQKGKREPPPTPLIHKMLTIDIWHYYAETVKIPLQNSFDPDRDPD